MAVHPAIDSIVAGCATALAGTLAIAQDIPIAGKDVGIVTLLVGAGVWGAKVGEKWLARMVEAIDRNSAAQADVGKKLALLMHATAEARKDGEDKRRAILEAISEVPDRVVDELKRTRTA